MQWHEKASGDLGSDLLRPLLEQDSFDGSITFGVLLQKQHRTKAHNLKHIAVDLKLFNGPRPLPTLEQCPPASSPPSPHSPQTYASKKVSTTHPALLSRNGVGRCRQDSAHLLPYGIFEIPTLGLGLHCESDED